MADRDGRNAKVKNRAPAEIQITAEQLLREAQERQEVNKLAPRQRIEDIEELQEYRSRKRQEFEEVIRRTRSNIRAWIKYANWESSQNEFARARSVFERALDVDTQDVKLWLAYTETELKARNVNHARNLFDRAVTLLPRLDQIWYKYVYLEELLGNVPGARQVFNRWMAWEPDEKAWTAYIKFEIRYKELELASQLYEKLVACHPEPRQFVKWSKYEEERGNIEKARQVYQMGLEYFGEEEEQLAKAQSLYSGFAKLEIRQKEYDRARVIYKYALDRLPRSKSSQLYASYTNFEKQHGDQRGLETTILGKRRIQYQEEIAHSPHNYDTWFDYIRLEEDALRNLRAADEQDEEEIKLVRDVYEKAIAQVPPSDQKRHWRRYIFLWLNYALFEEIECKDIDRARSVYKAAMQLIPHKTFTFAKLWLQYAYFEIRNGELSTARKILGTAIGLCPKQRLFKGYVELELRLKEFDRCRQLYQKNLEFDPSNASTWIKFSELERLLEDFSRARAIFELGVEESLLEMPEILWKAYIDFEFEMEEWDRTRALYERLLSKASHVKVWVSFASFEINVGKTITADLAGDDDDEEEEEQTREREDLPEEVKEQIQNVQKEALIHSRDVFQRGYKDLKSKGLKDERLILLEAWKSMEEENGDQEGIDKVQDMMPKVVQKLRTLEDGSQEKVSAIASFVGYIVTNRNHVFSSLSPNHKQYFDMIFRDDEAEKGANSFNLLEMAHAWKKKKERDNNEIQLDDV